MKVIDFSSNLSKGDFLVRFTFEDDTDVFLDENGYSCENFNNAKPDNYYIELAIKHYNSINKKK